MCVLVASKAHYPRLLPLKPSDVTIIQAMHLLCHCILASCFLVSLCMNAWMSLCSWLLSIPVEVVFGCHLHPATVLLLVLLLLFPAQGAQ